MELAPGPLSESGLDRLQELLAQRPGAMNIEMMDGLFSAAIAGPEVISPGECISAVLGGGLAAGGLSLAAAEELAALMMARWNQVAGALAAGDVSMPVLLEDKNGVTLANDWAAGFIRGTLIRPDGWNVLLNDENHGGAMIPALVLFHEHDPDPASRSPAIAPAMRETLIVEMAAGLVLAWRYFRSPAFTPPASFAAAEAGRNSPCPCGSGKRHKRCCGRAL